MPIPMDDCWTIWTLMGCFHSSLEEQDQAEKEFWAGGCGRSQWWLSSEAFTAWPLMMAVRPEDGASGNKYKRWWQNKPKGLCSIFLQITSPYLINPALQFSTLRTIKIYDTTGRLGKRMPPVTATQIRSIVNKSLFFNWVLNKERSLRPPLGFVA